MVLFLSFSLKKVPYHLEVVHAYKLMIFKTGVLSCWLKDKKGGVQERWAK